MNRRGFSLIEALVGISVLAVGLLSLAQAAALGLRVTNRARSDMQFYADVQQVMDSLMSRGWNKVTSGSTSVRQRTVSWTVTDITPKQQKLAMFVPRPSYQDPTKMAAETLVVYLANPTIVP